MTSKFPYYCSNCKQGFYFIKGHTTQHTPRTPLLVKCGHALCEVCIREGIRFNGSVKCSACSAVSSTATAITDIDSLRNEFPFFKYLCGAWYLRNFTEDVSVSFNFNNTLKKPGSKTELLVDFCVECNSTAFFACHQCEVNYCKRCFDIVHQKYRSQVHTKSRIKAKETNAPKPFKKPLCAEHDNKPFEFYCLDHNVPLCAHCAVFSHPGHTVVSIDDKNLSSVPCLEESMKGAIEMIAKLKHTHEKLSSNKTVKPVGVSVQELTNLEKKVMVDFVQLYGVLQLKEHELLSKIRHAKNNASNAQARMKEQLEASIKEIDSLLGTAKLCVEKKDWQNIDVEELRRKLEHVTESVPCHLFVEKQPEDTQEFKYNFEADCSLLKEIIDKCCELEYPRVPEIKLVSKDELPVDYTVDPSVSNLSSKLMKKYGFIDKQETGNYDKQEELTRHSSVSSLSSDGNSSGRLSATSSSILPQFECTPLLSAGSQETVFVTHINSPTDFYVVTKAFNKWLEYNLSRFNAYASKYSAPSPNEVVNGSVFLARHNMYKKNWQRVMVLHRVQDCPEKVEVLFIDHGNKATIEISSLRGLPARFRSEPAYAFHCALADCHAPNDSEWSKEAIQMMTLIVDNRAIQMYVLSVGGSIIEVDLIQTDDTMQVSLRDALIFLELATFTISRPQLAETKKHQQMYAKSNFSKDQILDCQISYVNSPTDFYCIELNETYQCLVELMEEMKEIYDDPKQSPGLVYTPFIGMAVAAKYVDDLWYRAVVTGLPGKREVDIFYVDFGNKERILYNRLRLLPTKFAKMNTQAIHCSLCDIIPSGKASEWSPEAAELMNHLILKPARLVVFDILDKLKLSIIFFAIKPTADVCLNALLVEQGYATSTGLNSTVVTFARIHNNEMLSNFQRTFNLRDDGLNVNLDAKDVVIIEKKNKKSGTASVISESSTAVTSETTENGVDAQRIEVRVLSVKSPSAIYVRLFNKQMDQDISSLNSALDEFYSGSVPNPKLNWVENDKCAVFNSEDSHWYRGLIQEVLPDSLRVFLKDIAKECTVPKSDVRKLEEQFLKDILEGSIRCHLAGVLAAGSGKQWAGYACERFAEELTKYKSVFITKKGTINAENKSLPVEIWVRHIKLGGALEPDSVEWRSMNAFIVDQGLAIPDRTYKQYIAPGEDLLKELKQMQEDSAGDITRDALVANWLQSSEDKPYLADKLIPGVQTLQLKKTNKPKRTFNTQDIRDWKPPVPLKNLDIQIIPTYVDENNVIFFHEASCEGALKQIEEALIRQYKDSKPQPQDMFWSVGQLCIAQYHSNGLWYRAKVLKINEDNSVVVVFVDYGNIEECRAHELRKRIFLTEIPLYCHKCILSDLNPISADGKWPTNVLDFIHSNVVEKWCDVKLTEPIPPSDIYNATSFSPPGGIELKEILVGMHYAVFISSSSEEALEDGDLDDDPDVIVCSIGSVEHESEPSAESQSKAFSLPNAPGGSEDIARKWIETESTTKSVPLDTIKLPEEEALDEIVASIMSTKIQNTPSPLPHESDVEINFDFSKLSASLGINIDNLKDAPMMLKPLTITELPADYEEGTGEETVDSDEDSAGDTILFGRSWADICEEEEQKDQKNVNSASIEKTNFVKLPLPSSRKLDVEVTAIRSLTSYYVVITETDDKQLQDIKKKYDSMSDEMQIEAPKNEVLAKPISVGQVCCAIYDEDQVWYRAVVESLNENDENAVKVRFVDFGNVENVKVENLRVIKKEWMTIPVQCFLVELHNIKVQTSADLQKALQKLTKIIFCPLVAEIQALQEPLSVKLYIKETGDLLYQPLIEMGALTES